jgi:gluconolactonase
MLLPTLAAFSSDAQEIIAPGAKLERLGTGYSFTEGPAVDSGGNVFFSDQPNDRILLWKVDGTISEWMKPCGRSNGMTFDHHGQLISCADDHNQLWSISPDREVTVLAKDFGGRLLNGPNDVWVRPDNGLYITDPLYPRDYWKRDPAMRQSCMGVYYMSPNRKEFKVVDSSLTKPNGIVGTADGKILYVSDIAGGVTYRYSIEPDGSLANKAAFCKMGSDGMTLDSRGNLYITGKGVTVFDPSGNQIEHIEVPERWTGNITFAGKDRQLLFITATTSVYGLRMAVKGIQ